MEKYKNLYYNRLARKFWYKSLVTNPHFRLPVGQKLTPIYRRDGI